MKLGLLTAPFPDTPLTEVADWASAAGFEALEIACWPKSSGPTRRYAGTSHIDVANLSAARGQGDRRRAGREEASRSRRSATIRIRCIPTRRTARPSSTT